MPAYTVGESTVHFGQAAHLADTCLLVGAFDGNDSWAGTAVPALEMLLQQGEILIPLAVVVETWGMLGRCERSYEICAEFIRWLVEHPRVILIAQATDRFSSAQELMLLPKVDCVDALLAHIADEISRTSGITNPIPIATFDTSDFHQCKAKQNLRLRTFDLRSLECI